MEKIIILVLCFFLSILSKAQILLVKDDQTPISNGQVLTYNTTDENMATLHYKIVNTSYNPIKVRIKVMNIQNATGNNFQFCYLSTCLPSIAVNAVYPSNSSSAINIDAYSETSSIGYNMWNSNAGSGTFPIDYTLKYYLVDNFNNEYGAPFIITYRYDPSSVLGTNEIKSEQHPFAEIQTTVIKNNIHITSKENISYSLHNTEGRLLFTGNLKKGESTIDTSTLNSGVYLLHLKDSQGNSLSKKIIKE